MTKKERVSTSTIYKVVSNKYPVLGGQRKMNPMLRFQLQYGLHHQTHRGYIPQDFWEHEQAFQQLMMMSFNLVGNHY